VIDVLSRRGYLNMKERGFGTFRRGALGQRALERPTILVTISIRFPMPKILPKVTAL
jgi:hypothetical protein